MGLPNIPYQHFKTRLRQPAHEAHAGAGKTMQSE